MTPRLARKHGTPAVREETPMKITFTLEVNEEGLADYYLRHPDLAVTDDMDASNTLIREAIANWNIEDLLETDDIYHLATVEFEE